MKFFLPVILAALLLLSCEKSVENFVENSASNADTLWATTNSISLEISPLQQALMRPGTTDSFSIQTGATLQTANGLRVEIPAAAFTGSLTGIAQAEVQLLRTKGDLIRFSKPSVSNGMVLQTAGTVYINLTKNGQTLSLQNNNTLRITVPDSIPQPLMRTYTGEAPAVSGFNVFNWQPNDNISIIPNVSGYQMLSNRQQWLSVAYGLDTVSQKSRVVLSMPAIYTNSNTLTFIVFKDRLSVVQLVPNIANRIWLAEKIPAGKNVVYVTLTKKGNDYWLGTQEIATTYNQNVHIIPQKKSLQAISDFLNNL